MPLIKAVGNMYDWVTHEYRPITGRCPHACQYCYVTAINKRYGNKQTELKLHESELRTNLGEGNIIFVCSTCDMFAKDIPDEWISKVLKRCWDFPKNTYLFQSKNAGKMAEFAHGFPNNTILATTIESNRIYNQMGKAPYPIFRANAMHTLKQLGFKTAVTIEPIFDFDIKELVDLIRYSQPDWVNIGADSKHHNLPEPSKEKVLALIEELSKFTEIKKKSNLQRLL